MSANVNIRLFDKVARILFEQGMANELQPYIYIL